MDHDMDHDRLRLLIDHPPRDAERAADPAFTASVMARLAPGPGLARPNRMALIAICGAVVAGAVLLLPADAFAGLDDLVTVFDIGSVAEVGVAAFVAALIAIRITVSERIHA